VLVTAGDISPDGGRLAVRTYTDLYEWSLDGAVPDDLADAVGGTPTVTPLPATPQGEGLAYTLDGSAVLVTSEGASAPVHRVPVAAPKPAAGDPTGASAGAAVPGAPVSPPGGFPWPVLAGAVGGGAALLAAWKLAGRRSPRVPGR
jgi:hypothetical protein